MLVGFGAIGPIGFVLAQFAFIQYVNNLATLVIQSLFYPLALQYLFDSVLSRAGHDEVVVRGRLFRSIPVSSMTLVKRWLLDAPNNFVFYPLTALNLLLSVIIAPLPIIGPLLSVMVNAPNRGKSAHNRYFQLKGIDNRQINAFYYSRRYQYMGFGFVSGILASFPFISLFFSFTTTTGAALWAAQIENQFILQRTGVDIQISDNQKREAFIMGPPWL
ncbi:hypothetical protein WICMUC_000986 [Wickerhamomyces mucosus]|uniref:Uncharacterized protein n=1 Tax=Wickerhamomyces mucosus TaxID=1378264 RepID=A0A9P8THW8_9ASCO|nr:hypothetical protein WICMUC_000986 [Wickerhamomyces mucosus]